MAKIQLSLTELGHKLLLEQGSFKTFKKFSVSDDGVRYDVTEEANLTDRITGGLRTLVTSVPTCGYACSEFIDKEVDDTDDVNTKFEWVMSKEDDCVDTLTSSNVKVDINIKTWFNYLSSKIGPSNYDYNNKLHIKLIENIKAVSKVLDPSDYSLNQIANYNNLNLSYIFENDKSKMDYENLNAYLMTTDRGKKKLKTSTDNKFWSPFLLVANTIQGQNGSSDDWVMSLSALEWGYAAIEKEDTNNVFRRSNFYTITQFESMSNDEINEKYKSVRPACITSKKRSNNDLFVLEDISGKFTEGVDMLPTYAQRFRNSDGVYLLESLINKSTNYIKTNFTPKEGEPNVFHKKINLRVNNKVFDGKKIEKNRFIGGNIEFNFIFDMDELDDNYDNIVKWN